MDQKGVRSQEAATVGIAFAAAFLPKRHVIDRPFLMWVERPGLSLPLFVGYITEEDWKSRERVGVGRTKTMCVLLTVRDRYPGTILNIRVLPLLVVDNSAFPHFA